MKPRAELVAPGLVLNHSASSGSVAIGGGTHTVLYQPARGVLPNLSNRRILDRRNAGLIGSTVRASQVAGRSPRALTTAAQALLERALVPLASVRPSPPRHMEATDTPDFSACPECCDSRRSSTREPLH
jgi:hypothetical protein